MLIQLQSCLRLIVFSVLSIALVSCHHDETITLSGSVSGTTIVAVNDAGDILASDNTDGKTPDGSGNFPFSLSDIETGINIRVFLITGEGSFPLYFDSDGDGTPDTNVFSASTSVDIDFGFVDTNVAGQAGRAIPTNNPVDVTDVTAAAEITATPANVSMISTWGFGRLKHRNNGTWAAKSGMFTYNADGTGSSAAQENDNNTLSSGTKTWTWTAANNPDGSITATRTFPDSSIKTRRVVISDDGMAMILDGTDNLNNQRFRVAVRMDPAKTHTNADFSGDYYFSNYLRFWHGALGSYVPGAQTGEFTPDGVGNYSTLVTSNVAGFVTTSTFTGAYTVATDGAVSVVPAPGNGYPAQLFISSNKLMGAGATSDTSDSWAIPFGMKKQDRDYSTADFAGSWAFIVFGDSNGASFFTEIGTMSCDIAGNCTSDFKQQRDGVTTIGTNPPLSIAVNADGTFGSSFPAPTPAIAGALGNDGNVFVLNRSFEDVTTRAAIIGIKCSACIALSSGGGAGLTQLTDNPANDSHPYFSPDQSKIAFSSNRAGNKDVWVINADGSSPQQLTTHAGNDERPYWSPDGTKLVFHSPRSGNEDLWTINADGTGLTQLTSHAATDSHPTWSPDGTKIAFQSNRGGNMDIWTINADGTGLAQLTSSADAETHPMWKADASMISYARIVASRDIWVMNADGSGQTALTSNAADEQHADWSPDGSKIAFRSNAIGNYDVWTMDADGSNHQQITTSPANDRNPDWSADGSKILFRSDRTGNNELWIIAVP